MPTYFTPKDGLFSFCGIWDSWKSPEGETIESFSIITVEPNALVAKLHDRMPAAVTDNRFGSWIAHDTPVKDLQSFLGPYPASKMQATPVSNYMNNVKNKGPQCIAPLSNG